MLVTLGRLRDLTSYPKRILDHLENDRLFRNSVLLMASTAIQSGLGFLFWVLCSKFFPPNEIGIATSVIAAMSLLISISLLGFNNVIIRFLANSDRQNQLISNSIVITIVFGTVLTLLFVSAAKFIGNAAFDSIADRFGNTVLYTLCLLFTTFTLISTICDSAFISYRKAQFVFYKSLAFSITKLIFPIGLIWLGSLGIIGSVALATITSGLFGLYLLVTKFGFRLDPNVHRDSFTKIKGYATGNYIASLFGMLPSTLLPIIVVSRLGAEDAAFFYMPMAIIALLNVIPSATTQSLFAEASNQTANLSKYIRSSVQHLFLMLVPAVLTIILTGDFILKFFGDPYQTNGTSALKILAIASLVGALNYFGDTILNVKKRINLFIFMNALNAILIVFLAYWFAPRGLESIALAYLIGQVITLLIYCLINFRLVVEIIQSFRDAAPAPIKPGV